MRETRIIVRRPARRRGRTTTLLAALALATLAVAAPAAFADTHGVTVGGDAVVKAGGDVYVAPGQSVDSVTVFGGNADIAGTVRHTVVTIGGNATIEATARVGTEMRATDTSAVAIGGTVTSKPGAVVTGDTGSIQGVTNGEVAIAAAVAFVGVMLGMATLVLLTIGGLVLTLAGLAGAAALVVWLARRDDREKAAARVALPYAPPTAA